MFKALDRLERFHVDDKLTMDGNLCFAGNFEPAPKTYESWVGYILDSDGRIFHGRFVFVTSWNKFTFHPQDPETIELKVGYSYYYLDGYWGERAALVLDRNRDWQRIEFRPQDAFEPVWSPRAGAHFWGKAGEHTNEPGHVIAGGWDHEHCAICWNKIAEFAQTHAYRSAPDVWVCEGCYTRDISPGTLDFMVDS